MKKLYYLEKLVKFLEGKGYTVVNTLFTDLMV